MPATSAKSNWISNYRNATQSLVESANRLKNLNDQYVALGYSSGGTALVDGDFTAANAGVTAAEVLAAVGVLTPIAKAITDNSAHAIDAFTSGVIYPIT